MNLFLMTVDSACEFYDACLMKEAVTEQERVAILMDMYKTGKISWAGRTDASKEEILSAMVEIANIYQIRKK